MAVGEAILGALNAEYGAGSWPPSGGGGASWGSITGTLSSQTDLNTALGGAGWVYVKLASDATSTSTTAADVSGFSFTPAANTTYEIEGRLIVQASATDNGPRPGWTWPSGLTVGVGSITIPNSATASALANGSSASGEVFAASTGVAVANRDYMGEMSALLVVGASPSGAFQMRLRAELTTSTVRLKAGSFFKYRVIP